MVFKYRPNFILSIFIMVLLCSIFLGYGLFQFFISPYLYIFAVILIVVPLLIAFSRKIIISDTGICVSNLWGIDKTEVLWSEIEEGFIVSKRVREERSDSSNNYSEMDWLAERMLGTVIRLIIEMKNPIVFNTKNIKQSKALIELIESRVNIMPNYN